jgi:hypothetical protein
VSATDHLLITLGLAVLSSEIGNIERQSQTYTVLARQSFLASKEAENRQKMRESSAGKELARKSDRYSNSQGLSEIKVAKSFHVMVELGQTTGTNPPG